MAARRVAKTSGSVDNLWHPKPPFCFCGRINYSNQTMSSDTQYIFVLVSVPSFFFFFFLSQSHRFPSTHVGQPDVTGSELWHLSDGALLFAVDRKCPSALCLARCGLCGAGKQSP